MPAQNSPGDPLGNVESAASVNVATPGNGNVSWTTVDLTGKVPPWARIAILSVHLAGGTNSGSYQNNQIDFRRDSTQNIIATVAATMAANGATTDLLGGTWTVWVPLTADHKFDYQKTDSTNQASSGATIALLGWV